MSVRICMQYFLPHLTNDQEIVEVEGKTIRECLEDFCRRYPKARRWIFREDGEMANFTDVFVNLKSTFPGELDQPVQDGDELFLMLMLSGG
jgi:molybdopterin converting factor small subunit